MTKKSKKIIAVFALISVLVAQVPGQAFAGEPLLALQNATLASGIGSLTANQFSSRVSLELGVDATESFLLNELPHRRLSRHLISPLLIASHCTRRAIVFCESFIAKHDYFLRVFKRECRIMVRMFVFKCSQAKNAVVSLFYALSAKAYWLYDSGLFHLLCMGLISASADYDFQVPHFIPDAGHVFLGGVLGSDTLLAALRELAQRIPQSNRPFLRRIQNRWLQPAGHEGAEESGLTILDSRANKQINLTRALAAVNAMEADAWVKAQVLLRDFLWNGAELTAFTDNNLAEIITLLEAAFASTPSQPVPLPAYSFNFIRDLLSVLERCRDSGSLQKARRQMYLLGVAASYDFPSRQTALFSHVFHLWLKEKMTAQTWTEVKSFLDILGKTNPADTGGIGLEILKQMADQVQDQQSLLSYFAYDENLLIQVIGMAMRWRLKKTETAITDFAFFPVRIWDDYYLLTQDQNLFSAQPAAVLLPLFGARVVSESKIKTQWLSGAYARQLEFPGVPAKEAANVLLATLDKLNLSMTTTEYMECFDSVLINAAERESGRVSRIEPTRALNQQALVRYAPFGISRAVQKRTSRGQPDLTSYYKRREFRTRFYNEPLSGFNPEGFSDLMRRAFFSHEDVVYPLLLPLQGSGWGLDREGQAWPQNPLFSSAAERRDQQPWAQDLRAEMAELNTILTTLQTSPDASRRREALDLLLDEEMLVILLAWFMTVSVAGNAASGSQRSREQMMEDMKRLVLAEANEHERSFFRDFMQYATFVGDVFCRILGTPASSQRHVRESDLHYLFNLSAWRFAEPFLALAGLELQSDQPRFAVADECFTALQLCDGAADLKLLRKITELTWTRIEGAGGYMNRPKALKDLWLQWCGNDALMPLYRNAFLLTAHQLDLLPAFEHYWIALLNAAHQGQANICAIPINTDHITPARIKQLEVWMHHFEKIKPPEGVFNQERLTWSALTITAEQIGNTLLTESEADLRQTADQLSSGVSPRHLNPDIDADPEERNYWEWELLQKMVMVALYTTNSKMLTSLYQIYQYLQAHGKGFETIVAESLWHDLIMQQDYLMDFNIGRSPKRLPRIEGTIPDYLEMADHEIFHEESPEEGIKERDKIANQLLELENIGYGAPAITQLRMEALFSKEGLAMLLRFLNNPTACRQYSKKRENYGYDLKGKNPSPLLHEFGRPLPKDPHEGILMILEAAAEAGYGSQALVSLDGASLLAQLQDYFRASRELSSELERTNLHERKMTRALVDLAEQGFSMVAIRKFLEDLENLNMVAQKRLVEWILREFPQEGNAAAELRAFFELRAKRYELLQEQVPAMFNRRYQLGLMQPDPAKWSQRQLEAIRIIGLRSPDLEQCLISNVRINMAAWNGNNEKTAHAQILAPAALRAITQPFYDEHQLSLLVLELAEREKQAVTRAEAAILIPAFGPLAIESLALQCRLNPAPTEVRQLVSEEVREVVYSSPTIRYLCERMPEDDFRRLLLEQILHRRIRHYSVKDCVEILAALYLPHRTLQQYWTSFTDPYFLEKIRVPFRKAAAQNEVIEESLVGILVSDLTESTIGNPKTKNLLEAILYLNPSHSFWEKMLREARKVQGEDDKNPFAESLMIALSKSLLKEKPADLSATSDVWIEKNVAALEGLLFFAENKFRLQSRDWYWYTAGGQPDDDDDKEQFKVRFDSARGNVRKVMGNDDEWYDDVRVMIAYHEIENLVRYVVSGGTHHPKKIWPFLDTFMFQAYVGTPVAGQLENAIRKVRDEIAEEHDPNRAYRETPGMIASLARDDASEEEYQHGIELLNALDEKSRVDPAFCAELLVTMLKDESFHKNLRSVEKLMELILRTGGYIDIAKSGKNGLVVTALSGFITDEVADEYAVFLALLLMWGIKNCLSLNTNFNQNYDSTWKRLRQESLFRLLPYLDLTGPLSRKSIPFASGKSKSFNELLAGVYGAIFDDTVLPQCGFPSITYFMMAEGVSREDVDAIRIKGETWFSFFGKYFHEWGKDETEIDTMKRRLKLRFAESLARAENEMLQKRQPAIEARSESGTQMLQFSIFSVVLLTWLFSKPGWGLLALLGAETILYAFSNHAVWRSGQVVVTRHDETGPKDDLVRFDSTIKMFAVAEPARRAELHDLTSLMSA